MGFFSQKKYVNHIKLIEQTDINRLKKKVKILFVDDEEFKIVKLSFHLSGRLLVAKKENRYFIGALEE